jgi:hypothetical protein
LSLFHGGNTSSNLVRDARDFNEAEHPDIAELDINPLCVLAEGCVAPDTVMVEGSRSPRWKAANA